MTESEIFEALRKFAEMGIAKAGSRENSLPKRTRSKKSTTDYKALILSGKRATKYNRT